MLEFPLWVWNNLVQEGSPVIVCSYFYMKTCFITLQLAENLLMSLSDLHFCVEIRK